MNYADKVLFTARKTTIEVVAVPLSQMAVVYLYSVPGGAFCLV